MDAIGFGVFMLAAIGLFVWLAWKGLRHVKAATGRLEQFGQVAALMAIAVVFATGLLEPLGAGGAAMWVSTALVMVALVALIADPIDRWVYEGLLARRCRRYGAPVRPVALPGSVGVALVAVAALVGLIIAAVRADRALDGVQMTQEAMVTAITVTVVGMVGWVVLVIITAVLVYFLLGRLRTDQLADWATDVEAWRANTAQTDVAAADAAYAEAVAGHYRINRAIAVRVGRASAEDDTDGVGIAQDLTRVR